MDPTRVNELLVGLGSDIEGVGVVDTPDRPLRVVVQLRSLRPVCGSSGGSVWSSGVRRVELVDLGAFGRTVSTGANDHNRGPAFFNEIAVLAYFLARRFGANALMASGQLDEFVASAEDATRQDRHFRGLGSR